MSFIKTGESELISVVKTQNGKDNVLKHCAKCNGWHMPSEPCQADKNKEKMFETKEKDK